MSIEYVLRTYIVAVVVVVAAIALQNFSFTNELQTCSIVVVICTKYPRVEWWLYTGVLRMDTGTYS